MKTKILVIIISFIFLFMYNLQCFATTDIVNKEINNTTKNEETEDTIAENITKENTVAEFEKTEEMEIIQEGNIILEDQVEKENEEIIENDENINEVENEIINKENNLGISNYSGMINIDSPINNQSFNTRDNGTIIHVCGWAVSNISNAKLQCFLDGNIVNTNFERVIRTDVDNLISPDYGGVSINSKAGFNCLIDISLIKTGSHILNIKELSQDNQLICESKISLNIENQPYIRKYVYRCTVCKSNLYKTG